MEGQIPTSHLSDSFIIHDLYLIQTMTTVTKQKTEKLSKVLQYEMKMKCMFIKVYTIKTVRVNISKSGDCKGLRKTTKKM